MGFAAPCPPQARSLGSTGLCRSVRLRAGGRARRGRVGKVGRWAAGRLPCAPPKPSLSETPQERPDLGSQAGSPRSCDPSLLPQTNPPGARVAETRTPPPPGPGTPTWSLSSFQPARPLLPLAMGTGQDACLSFPTALGRWGQWLRGGGWDSDPVPSGVPGGPLGSGGFRPGGEDSGPGSQASPCPHPSQVSSRYSRCLQPTTDQALPSPCWGLTSRHLMGAAGRRGAGQCTEVGRCLPSCSSDHPGSLSAPSPSPPSRGAFVEVLMGYRPHCTPLTPHCIPGWELPPCSREHPVPGWKFPARKGCGRGAGDRRACGCCLRGGCCLWVQGTMQPAWGSPSPGQRPESGPGGGISP